MGDGDEDIEVFVKGLGRYTLNEGRKYRKLGTPYVSRDFPVK